MIDIDLKLEFDSYRLTNGQITGEIYFRYNNNFFPEINWNDFPIIILNWWSLEILKKVEEYQFNFMDGPFYINIEKKASNLCNLNLMKRGKKTICIDSFQTKQNVLEMCILKGINSLIKFYEKREWITDDLTQLKNNYSKLSKNT